ncbi:hypothetical protein [Hoylesella marshii]|uniref:hypothetical protein n=1 Tax=Hoylesella marshii TaxID=189722 RepID=UPI0028D6A15E|nr:hypothetical protein [Hoylesella marshii]
MKNKILTLLLTIIAMMWAGNVQAQQSFEIDGGEINFTTSANLTGSWLQSGKVSWDAMTKTLTLDNAILVAKKNAFNFIDIRHIGWTLRLIGSNSITTSGWTGITTVAADLKIKGGGSLKIDAQVYAISHTGADKGVTIENCTVETSKSFSGTKGNGSSLAIKNATVKFSKVMNFKSISLVGCKIKVPVNGRVDTNDYGMQIIVDKDGEEAKSVEIEAGPAINYDLSICGTKVTSANCDNLSALDGVEGTVSYDDDTKTLTLNNATIRTAGNIAIYNMIDGLTIKVIGTNNIATESNRVIFCGRGTTFTGSGTLNAENRTTAFVMFGAVTIDGCTVNIKGDIMGFNGTSGENLTVRNATVTVEGNVAGSIRLLNSLTLEGCAITQPVGAKFDLREHAVTLNGEIVKSKVVITKGATGINTPTADIPAFKRGIYTLEGVCLKDKFNSLPKGVYIVDGKKVVKQ